VSRICGIPYRRGPERYRSTADAAAQKLGITLKVAPVRTRDELDAVFSDFARERVDAVLVQQDPIFYTARERNHAACRQDIACRRCTPRAEFVEIGAGSCRSARISSTSSGGAAFYVDKVLKGAKPADSRSSSPRASSWSSIALTAATLGLSIPPSVLVRADRL
jgi:putative ABC transport system substrate-binding protein